MANELVMILGGDLHVQRPDPESMFARVAPTLREAGIVFGNLEGVLSEPVPPHVGNGHLRGDPEMLAAYKSAGFDILGVGNHGSTCCGTEALVRCLEMLDKEGIAHAGGGRNREEARRPGIVERGGTRVAFLAYSCLSDRHFFATEGSAGVAAVRAHTTYEFHAATSPGAIPMAHTQTYPEDLAMVVEDVRRAKGEADIVVATWHWGIGPMANGSLAGKVLHYQTELAHAAIDNGCDLVIGHHPHVLSAIEVYKGKAIFYSLGNFAFDYLADRARAASLYRGVPRMRRVSFGLARCVIQDREVCEVSLLPMRIPREDPRPVLLDTTQGRDIVELAEDVSEEFGTRLRARQSDVLVVEATSGRRAPA